MGAAVTKYHRDQDGFFKIDEFCPGMSVDGKPINCVKPSEATSDEERKLGERKYYLVSDAVANPQMGSMLPYPVDQPGFFLDTMDHETKKDISGDASAMQKALYFITTQRDPRISSPENVKTAQVPSTWCSHIQPCPSGVPCCPEVTPAIPVVRPPTGSEKSSIATFGEGLTKDWKRTAFYILVIAAIIAFVFFMTRRRSPGMARARRAFGRPATRPAFEYDARQ
jgi:hypothetical protein